MEGAKNNLPLWSYSGIVTFHSLEVFCCSPPRHQSAPALLWQVPQHGPGLARWEATPRLPAPQLSGLHKGWTASCLSSPQRCPHRSVKEPLPTSSQLVQSPFQVPSVFSYCVRRELCVTGFPWGSTCVTAGGQSGSETAGSDSDCICAPCSCQQLCGSSTPRHFHCRQQFASRSQQALAAEALHSRCWELKGATPAFFPFRCRGRALTQGIQLCSFQPHLATWLLLWNATPAK